MTGPSDHPSDRTTEYGADGTQQRQVFEPQPDAAAPDFAPAPWYRNRLLLALWALLVALLLTLVGYGIVELSRGGGGEINGPATTTSSTTPTRSSTTSPTTAPSTTTDTTPPDESPEQTPDEAPPANNSPAPGAPPTHHHHHPHIPSTITLPHTVITLPHGF